MSFRSFTSCNIGGNLGRDPEIRYTKNGDPVATLSVAVNVKAADKTEETIWVRLTVFGPQAEWLKEARKGDHVLALNMGYRVDEWEGRDGEAKRTHHFRTTFGSEVMFSKGAGRSRQDMAGEENQERPSYEAFSPEKRVENSSPNDLPPNDEPPF